MRLTDLRRLNGPNIYTSRPVTVARLELDDLTGHETSAHLGFGARLLTALPGLAEHHCAAGQPGGFVRAMARGTYFGHVTEHVALELSGLAGRDVYFGRTVWAGADGRYDVVMECPWDEPADSPVPRDLLCLGQRGLRPGNAVQKPATLRPFFFLRLDFIPAAFDFSGGARVAVRKDVRVAPH